ncbi:MAG: asparagine synthase C-terminal domain-containing protein [Nanoarchaeota archaeon]|nr:asparagine synthase C-terminal domain-containing protein [Nanoarchaeota archaeon]MBU1623221.1 asparagine synthase C-terminal domain-containing protein [Nanoarchaeota archaeon]MBU1974679.1 asparagine synthase C-terminal domain-containing protein [Nanoarchaeota archaeon]
MQEIWLKNDELISKEEWGKLIDSLKHKKLIHKKEQAQQILKDKLIKAVKQRIPQEKFGLFFSGGVDSSFIAAIFKLMNKEFVCYTVGFQDETKEPEDVTEAKKVAKKLGLKIQTKIYNLKEVEEIIKKTINILKPKQKIDVVSIGVGAVVLACAEMGITQNITTFFSGLGSEEIFAGYERHDQAKDINQECWQGLKYMHERDLIRDYTIAKELNITIKTPFLDKELIEYAMTLPGNWKIVNDKKKVIFREIAEEFLKEFAWRKKKAAQYGSCFDKAISKLARKNGFKFKKDYLESL